MKPYFTRYYQYNTRKVLDLVDRFDELRIALDDTQIEALNEVASFEGSLMNYAGIEAYPTAIKHIVCCWFDRFICGLAVLMGRIN